MTNQEIEQELLRLFAEAAPHRRKQILDNIEYQLARNTDVAAAYEIAYRIVFGSGATKRDRKRAAKQIKKEDFVRRLLE
jgi:hypothetical protein